MPSVDIHLEEALSDYNRKVSELERTGPLSELLSAYLNRGSVLMLMESYVSAITDMDAAVEIIEEMEAAGNEVEPGIYVKVFENRGQLLFTSDPEGMADDYRMIIPRLDDLDGTTRHYNPDDVATMCLNCAEDLIDTGFEDEALPFLEKAIFLLQGDDDPWCLNRLTEAHNLKAKVLEDAGDKESAERHYGIAIEIGSGLYETGDLEDIMELAMSYVCRGDILEETGRIDEFVSDHVAAAEILDVLFDRNELDDIELLVSIHQGIASALMKEGRMKEAEKHLLSAMRMGVDGIEDTMISLGINPQ
ncbi:MAG: hypothetical protein PHW16_05655 [Candidatus Methanomethylophilaceae archaeon]|nr:hypothetical protein [Candidatus Methanomethylophilaceae archaeon]